MSDWVKTTLGGLITLQRGFDITKVSQSNGLYPVISSSGVTSFHNHFMVEGPGVVVGRKGTLGTAFFVSDNYWPHDTTLWVKDFKGNDAKFIYYFLKIISLEKLDSGSANPTLNRNYAHLLKVTAPDSKTQKRIAAVLSALDAKIDLNHRINAELEALAKTIYDYWFVQFDFPDAHGRPYRSSGGAMVWNDTLKREIPVGWKAQPLSELGSFRNGINYDPSIGGDSVARIVNVRNVSATSIFLKSDDLDELEFDQADIDKYLVTADSILIARSGIPGATRMMQPCPANTIYCGFIICLKVANAENKLLLFFRLKQLEQSLLSQSSGSILKNVSQDTLKDISLAVPRERSVIEKFNAAIVPLFEKISANNLENIELTQLRDWLLPLLMNGQVRVG